MNKPKSMNKQKSGQSKWAKFSRPDGSFDFEALTDAQKEEFYQECETISADKAKPLTPAQRRLHARTKRRGRPRKGKGAEIISLSIEKTLLRQAERLAKAEGLSRSDLFSRGLRALLAVKGAA
jgi:hypothetical protein